MHVEQQLLHSNRIYQIVIGQYLMAFFECREENIGEVYCYRQEIETELIKSISGRRKGGQNDCKIIRMISKTLRLSLLEANVLSWLLQRSQGLTFQGLANVPAASWIEGREDNCFFLELLLNGYYVKSYLASLTLRQIEADIKILLPSFCDIYSAWRPCFPLSQLRIQELNKPFENWSQQANSGVKDYNLAVKKILQLSKSYKIGGKEKTHPQKSSQEEMFEVNSEQPRLPFDMESRLSFQHSNHLSYSEVEDEMRLGNQEKVFRPFGASSGRGELRDMNLESVFESKNILEPSKADLNPQVELPRSKQKKKERIKIKQTYSFLEDPMQ